MPIYTVSQVARYLKDALDQDPILANIWISGEISNLTRSSAGHYYFTIKDAECQLRCVFFRPAPGAELLANGAAVISHGRISFYETRGELQLYVDMVQPEGVGEMELEFQRLKEKLEREGLFEPTRKRELPLFPKKIAVVTSPTGAVFHDIANIVSRRYPLAELLLVPTPVQGDEAVEGIVRALDYLNHQDDIDTVILARGGGSLEELWTFNEEAVARAIYASRHPTVSAIGHETDYTIADMVADKRAPTPSAAAEMVVPHQQELRNNISLLRRSMESAIQDLVRQQKREVSHLVERLQSLAPDVPRWRQRLDDLLHTASTILGSYLELRREQVRGREAHLASLSPSSTLARGYAVVRKEGESTPITRVAQVSTGDALRVHVSDGSFGAQVQDSGAKPSRGRRRSEKKQPLSRETMPRLL